jgi:hypothetical protein
MATPANANEPATKRVGDPELIAMNEISKALEKVQGPARNRVLKWLADKYDIPASIDDTRLGS